jgi:hypothetical protein
MIKFNNMCVMNHCRNHKRCSLILYLKKLKNMSYDLVDNMEYIQAFKKKSTAWKTLKNRVSF